MPKTAVFLKSLGVHVDVETSRLTCSQCLVLMFPTKFMTYACNHSYCVSCDPHSSKCPRCTGAAPHTVNDPLILEALKSCPRVSVCGHAMESYDVLYKHMHKCMDCVRISAKAMLDRANLRVAILEKEHTNVSAHNQALRTELVKLKDVAIKSKELETALRDMKRKYEHIGNEAEKKSKLECSIQRVENETLATEIKSVRAKNIGLFTENVALSEENVGLSTENEKLKKDLKYVKELTEEDTDSDPDFNEDD